MALDEGKPRNVAFALEHLAKAYAIDDRNGKAEQTFLEGLELAKECHGQSELYILYALNLVKFYKTSSQLKKGQDLAKRLVVLSQAVLSTILQFTEYNSLFRAREFAREGRHERALESYKRHLATWQKYMVKGTQR